MYGRDIKGEQICVVDDSFEPFFYALVDGNVFLEKEIKAINVVLNVGLAALTPGRPALISPSTRR